MRKSIKKIIALSISTMSLLATTSISANAEWRQSPNGLWWYTEGDSWSIGWRQINDQWYYFDTTGYMKTGWLQDTDGKWYYLSPSTGEMEKNTITTDGYKIGEDGVWINTNIDTTVQTNANTQDSAIQQPTNTSENNSSNSSSSGYNSSSSSSTSSNTNNKNLFSVIFRLDDLHIHAMAGGSQQLYGSKVGTYGIIVLDARDYNQTRTDIMECDWKKTWHIEKDGYTYKLVRNTGSTTDTEDTTNSSTTLPTIAPSATTPSAVVIEPSSATTPSSVTIV